jgi:ribonuclease-3
VTADLRELARALGCRIGRKELFVQALTHRSAAANNNERLEFVGDALLGFVIAEALLERFPDADEGRLSRLRATLVNKESLAILARGLRLSDHLRLGAGELRTGGHARDSILADAFEAVLAAVYLDQGFDGARQVILALFGELLQAQGEGGAFKDPKTRLQEALQARRRPLPEYQVSAVTGSQHAQTFRVHCNLVDNGWTSEGEGTSRRRAEQRAAEVMLVRLEDDERAS